MSQRVHAPLSHKRQRDDQEHAANVVEDKVFTTISLFSGFFA